MPQNRTYGTNRINETDENNNSFKLVADVDKAEQKGTLVQVGTKGIIHVVASDKTLVTVSTICNKNGIARKRHTGINIVLPFQKAYYIKRSIKTEPLKNSKQKDGRFSLNIGLGEDALFDIEKTYEWIQTSKDATKIIKQIDEYNKSIDTYAIKILHIKLEKMMAEGMNFGVTTDGKDDILLAQTIREIVSIDIDEIMKKIARREPIDKYEDRISEEALNLKKECGVRIKRLTITDVDINKKLKEIKEKALIAEKEREIKAKDAENERNIQKAQAEMNAEIAKINAKAANEEMSERMKKLKRLGMSDEAIKDYIMKEYDLKAIEKLPTNAVAIVNSGSGNNLMSEVVAAEEAARRKK